MPCHPFTLSHTPALFLLWCSREFRSILLWSASETPWERAPGMLERRRCDNSYSQLCAGIQQLCFQLSLQVTDLSPAVPKIPPTCGFAPAFAKPVFFRPSLSLITVFLHPPLPAAPPVLATHPEFPAETLDTRKPMDTACTGVASANTTLLPVPS